MLAEKLMDLVEKLGNSPLKETMEKLAKKRERGLA